MVSRPWIFWHQNSPSIQDTAESYEWFGAALTARDFSDDGYADLAIGVPWEGLYDLSATFHQAAGATHVLYGSIGGLVPFALADTPTAQFWHQNSPGVDDEIEADELFGFALTSGDFNGDGFGDLAIGVPYEVMGTVRYAGAVHVLYGSLNGLTATANGFQFWHQDRPWIENVAQFGDHFGRSLTAGDFDNDGFDDLVVGVPRETVGSVGQAGAVNVLHGSQFGVANLEVQFWHQNVPDVDGDVASADSFGSALAAGDFNGDQFDDLAIGIPGEELFGSEPLRDAGAVSVIYGTSIGLSATYISDQRWTQSLGLVIEY